MLFLGSSPQHAGYWLTKHAGEDAKPLCWSSSVCLQAQLDRLIPLPIPTSFSATSFKRP